MMSITTLYRYICTSRQDSVVSGTNGLLISDFGSSTRGKRHNSYYANHSQRAVHLVMFKISVGRDPKNLTPTTTVENSTLCLHGPISTLNWLFFKILKFLGPSLPGMTSSILQAHFLSGVYYDNGACYILCAQE